MGQNRNGAPEETRPWPNCAACDAGGRCSYQRAVQTMVRKAEVFLGLARHDDAEELIGAAFSLCDEVPH